MSVRWIAIALTNGKTVFHDGDVIHAACNLEIGHGTEVRGIVVKFRGQAKAQWMDKRGKRQYTRCTKLNLVKAKQYLNLGQGALNPGVYTLPFAFQLPNKVVTTLEGTYGYVRYWLEASQLKSWLTINRKAKLQLKVLQLIDTNVMEYNFPIGATDSATKEGCACCVAGPFFLEAQTDRAAYCPNDIFSISACIKINNPKTQARPTVKLVQKRSFFAENRSMEIVESIKLEALGGDSFIDEHGYTVWQGMQFEIPECLPTVDCAILRNTYHIEISLEIPWKRVLEVYLPIVIGTIPFQPESVFQRTHHLSDDFDGSEHGEKTWSGTGKHTPKDSNKANRSRRPPATRLLPPKNIGSTGWPPSFFDALLRAEMPTLDDVADDEDPDEELSDFV